MAMKPSRSISFAPSAVFASSGGCLVSLESPAHTLERQAALHGGHQDLAVLSGAQQLNFFLSTTFSGAAPGLRRPGCPQARDGSRPRGESLGEINREYPSRTGLLDPWCLDARIDSVPRFMLPFLPQQVPEELAFAQEALQAEDWKDEKKPPNEGGPIRNCGVDSRADTTPSPDWSGIRTCVTPGVIGVTSGARQRGETDVEKDRPIPDPTSDP
eukprot:scaffold429_cov269-Pinguiococcus_pyrenoidosus.AAC.37